MKRIELLDKSHARDKFDCGNEALNHYLKAIARQHIQKGISRTFVLVDSEKPLDIMGFFSLSLCEVQAKKLPLRLAKKYPLKVPGVKLARLAVAKEFQKQGIGEILMFEAMRKAYIISENAGVIGLFVDVKDEKAKSYYEQYGFVSLEDNLLEMFLPLKIINQLL